MKQTLHTLLNKWKTNGIMTIGGLFIGAGVADCLFAFDQFDLNQMARGLTIFSAGLTILVVMDNSKTQKENENIQRATQLHLEQIEKKLATLEQAQHQPDSQLQGKLQTMNELMQQLLSSQHSPDHKATPSKD